MLIEEQKGRWVNMNIRKQLDELKKERRIRDINEGRDVNDPLRTKLGYSEKRYRNRIEGYLNDINKAIEKPFSVLKDMDGQTLPDKYNVRQGTVTEEDRERYTVAINKLIKTSYELQNILSELEGWGN
jgi:cell division protein YceG involved in septum cleavage